MPRVNPEILAWARTTAALEVGDAARKLGLGDSQSLSAADKLRALESGDREPSRTILRSMETLYRRPLLTFYLDRPPAPHTTPADFRSHRHHHAPQEGARLRALLRDILVRQSVLREALLDEDEVAPLPFIGSRRQADGWEAVLASVQEIIRIDRQELRRRKDPAVGFRLLREQVEAAGVFVLLKSDLGNYRTRLETTVFRGFAIADEVAPFIVISDQDAVPARSFTLLHEVVHLILGQTGHSDLWADNEVERFCDRVASHFLVTEGELDDAVRGKDLRFDDPGRDIEQLADLFRVSRSMIAYRARDLGLLSHAQYAAMLAQYHGQWQAARKKQREGNPDLILKPQVFRRSRLGRRLISEVQRLVKAKSLTIPRAARILGTPPIQVARVLG